MTATRTPSTSWAALAAWRCEGEPWEATGGTEHTDAGLTLLCRCGRASYEHNPDLAGAPHDDVVTGARLCRGFDPVARVRRVHRWELQTARPDRLDHTPED